MDRPPSDSGQPEFSLVRGGPWYQIQMALRLLNPKSLRVVSRAIFYALLAWLPLAILSLLDGTAFGLPGRVSFVEDFAIHARLLIALPILVIAEATTDRWTRTIVSHLSTSGIVVAEGRAGFEQAVRSSARLRDSWVVELFIIGLAILGGWTRVIHGVRDFGVWFEGAAIGGHALSPAGWWLGLVATPLFVSIFIRSLWRFAIWSRFLWLLSRTPLDLRGAHPDRMGGLGTIQIAQRAFAPTFVAIGVLCSAAIANRVIHLGASLLGFKMVIASLLVIAACVYLAPLLAFIPRLTICKRQGLLDYDRLGAEYVRRFGRKWIDPEAPSTEPLLGTSDIQSLADIGGAFLRVEEMKVIPMDVKTAMVPILSVGLPILPLALTVMPLGDLLKLLMKAVL